MYSSLLSYFKFCILCSVYKLVIWLLVVILSFSYIKWSVKEPSWWNNTKRMGYIEIGIFVCYLSYALSMDISYLYSYSISVTIMFLQGSYGQPAVRSNSKVYGEHYYSQLFVCHLSPSWFAKTSYFYLFNSRPLMCLNLKHLWSQSTEALKAIRFLELFLQSLGSWWS